MLDIQRIPTPQMQNPVRVTDWPQCNVRVEPRIERAMEKLRAQLRVDLFSGFEETVTCDQFSFTERQLSSKSMFISALVRKAVVQMMKERSAEQPIQD